MSETQSALQTLLIDTLESLQGYFIEGLSEYELIKTLQAPPFSLFDEDALHDPLVMFQTHFILFHCLYQLRTAWRSQNIGELEIGPTAIKLHPAIKLHSAMLQSAAMESEDPLAKYYLNWENLSETDAGDVEALLNSFWQKMGSNGANASATQEELEDAIRILELPSIESINLAQLKQQYRKHQHISHPDKGGSVEQSQLVLHSYTLLSRHLILKK